MVPIFPALFTIQRGTGQFGKISRSNTNISTALFTIRRGTGRTTVGVVGERQSYYNVCDSWAERGERVPLSQLNCRYSTGELIIIIGRVSERFINSILAASRLWAFEPLRVLGTRSMPRIRR